MDPSALRAAIAGSESVDVYTDGSYPYYGILMAHPRPAGWAFVAVADGVPVFASYGRTLTAESRQNDGENEAIIRAASFARSIGVSAKIMTDCETAVLQALGTSKARGAMATRYVAEWRRLSVPGLSISHIHGHFGNRWNAMADRLARQGLVMPEPIELGPAELRGMFWG